MGTKYGPHMITDGLVLYLDSGNSLSYPGDGSIWYDLSENNYHWSIDSSGITYKNEGYFSLEGNTSVDNGVYYNNIITTSSEVTLVYWMKINDNQALFLSEDSQSMWYVGAYRSTNSEYYSNCGTPVFTIDTIDKSNIYDYISDNEWHMIEFKSVNLSSWTYYCFNRYSAYNFNNSYIASLMMYDRNLTQGESLQNYYALKSRFDL